MTKKRFTYEYDEYNGNLFDNKMNTFYHIEDSDENIKLLCDRLNWLVEENERLKEYNNKLMKQPLLFDVQTIPNTMEIMEANTQLEEENEQLQARNKYLAMKIQRERNSTQKQYAKWEKEAETKIKELSEENEQLKKEKDYYKRELQKDLVCQAIIDGREKND